MRFGVCMLLTCCLSLACEPGKKQVDTRTKTPPAAKGDALDGLASGPFVFLNPAKKNEKAKDAFKIKIVTRDLDESTMWSLFYTKNDNETKGANVVAANIPLTMNEITLNTSKLRSGTYYIFAAYLSEGGAEQTVFAKGSIQVRHENEVNSAPIVQLENLNGKEILDPDQSQRVDFLALDADHDELSYKLQYSMDSGGSFVDVAGEDVERVENGSGSYSFIWEISSADRYPLNRITYRARVVVDDGNGGEVKVTSAKDFAIATAIPTYEGEIKTLLGERCGTCHTTDMPLKGGFDSQNYDKVVTQSDDKIKNNIAAKILGASTITGASMPVDGVLEDTDLAKIILFLWAGQPQN